MGDNNSGNNNLGDNNSGDNNSGDNNSGDNNSGDNNSGDKPTTGLNATSSLVIFGGLAIVLGVCLALERKVVKK